jgi:hypothetical protein
MGLDRVRPLGGIDEIWVRSAEPGIVNHIVGIVIGIGPVIGGSVAIVGPRQAIKGVIGVGPQVRIVSIVY